MPYVIIDNYFPLELARKLEGEFPSYEDAQWWVYDNPLENKKAMNSWERFPPATYRAFHRMCMEAPGNTVADYGLHGGGWHISCNGGNLNPHRDYVIHPKLKMQRKYNLIVYLSSDWNSEHGGRLGLWGDRDGQPGSLLKAIDPVFNRVVMFDVSGDGWHGMVEPYSGTFRKSMAVYFVQDPQEGCGDRSKALFAARHGQSAAVRALIERRAKGDYI